MIKMTEKQMRYALLTKKTEGCVRIQKLNENIASMERTDNPSRYDALVRLRYRAEEDMEKRVSRMSFPQVMDALLPY